MKRLLLCFLSFSFLTFISDVRAQVKKSNLVGFWQVNTVRTGSALQACYQFFANGEFVYSFDEYDNRSRIRGASGKYTLEGKTLRLYIKYRKEIVGGELVQGGMGFQSEEIVLEGGKLIKVPQTSKVPIEIDIEICQSKEGFSCMKLQNNTYYKLSSNPKETVFKP